MGSIEYQGKEKMANYWQVKQSNHSRFPILNIESPFWSVDSETYETKILNEDESAKKWAAMRDLCGGNALAYDSQQLKKLEGQFGGIPDQILTAMKGNVSEDNLFHKLHNRLLQGQKTRGEISDVVRSITDAIMEDYKSGAMSPNARDFAGELLLGKWNKNTSQLESTKVTVLLDFHDYEAVGSIYSASSRKQLNHCLLDTETTEQSETVCALTGEKIPVETLKSPQPTLPKIGLTYLMSMNKDADCHYRYRLISTGIIPIGVDTYRELTNSLQKITEPAKRGLTWNAIPSPKPKGVDLLIIYLETLPEADLQMASMFSEAPQEEQRENAFEHICKTVCEALRGNPAIEPHSALRLFVISAIDPGRKQMVVNTSFTVRDVFLGAEQWETGSSNVPLFSLPVRIDSTTTQQTTQMPSPASIMELFKSQWNRLGHGRSDVSGITLSEVYDVYIPGSPRMRRNSKKLLRLLLLRTEPLLIGIGGVIKNPGENEKSWKDFTAMARNHCLAVVAFLGILLSKLDITKEKYMYEVPFNVGRMLNLADTLHHEYCKIVRKSVPMRLMGNAHLSVALNNPEKALSMLAERIGIYQAWATTAKSDSVGGEIDPRQAKLTLEQLGLIVELLKGKTIPSKAADSDRAQILLGYLARHEKE
ncbi:MAG: hypothetical protein SGI97_01885 [candidate division Zixibacteria bacterium]|nr:hypothetical protein [candidate division Zixibacteria bacterium]